ncbi:MAG TPA: PHP domain-containing protein [Streptosporangiaceae bacterium]|nr:PHP domain-containing protein [Streptosporangiaceae bacterium]
MRADLHSHSSVSDGTEPPAIVIRRAAEAGLDAIALTDHDTVAGHREAASALPAGLTLVPGAELSCRLEGHSVHMLAYLFDPQNDELAGEMAEIRESRLHRARAMVDKLAELGVPITWEQVSEIASGGVVGRPHIARAMIDAGVVSSVDEAFTPEWIGPGGRAHVSRYALDPARAIRLVRSAGGVTVLAHPRGVSRGWQVPDEVIAALAAAGLAGIEVNHPQQDEAERRRLSELASSLGLIPSGGSDDHGALTGYRIGTEVAPDGSYADLISRATGASPVTGS